jgi:DNA-binding CsgD family transcriptional regulator
LPSLDHMPALWPLVGRQAELELIQRTLDGAAAGMCSALLLRGESGIGKTRLAQVAVRHAIEEGWTVASGSAYTVETGVPYALFADAFVPVLRSLGDATVTLLSRGATAQLAHVFPALAAGRQDPTDLSVSSPELKGRVLWTVAQLLAGLSSRTPLLLVIENLQWADPSSLELLHFVVRQVRQARLAIVATVNDSEADSRTALGATLRSLIDMGVAVSRTVAPLQRVEVEALLRQVLGDGVVPRDAVALLFGWTRGNPFFLEQTIKSLIATGRLKRRNGTWVGWDLEGLQLPASIRDALAIRVGLLGPAARAVADCGAVIGARLTVDGLRAATGMDSPMLLAALDELCRRNVLSGQLADEHLTYDFTHPMVRDTLYEELGIGRRAVLHAQVADALERLWGAGAADHADELAFHFVHASRGDLTPKAVRYLMRAGESALEKHADREATRYLGAALEHWDRHGVSTTQGASSPAVPVTDLVARLALANQRVGNHDAALALWERVRAGAVATGDVALIAKVERRLGLACYWRGRPADGLRHGEEGLRAAMSAGGRGLIAQLRVVMAACLVELGRPNDARGALLDALADAESSGDIALHARVHRQLLLTAIVTCSAAQARDHASQTLDLAERSGQLDVACTAHWALAVVAGLTGNARELETRLREAERIADELRSPSLRLSTAEVAIEYLAGLGEWTEALARAEQSISLARAIRSDTILARLLVWTAVIYVGRGDLERARTYLDEAAAIAGLDRKAGAHDVNSALRVQMGLAMYHNAIGAHDEAIRISRAGLALAEQSGQAIWAIYRLWPALIEAHLWKREFDEAERLSRQLRQESELIGHRLGLAWAEVGEALAQMLRGTTPALLERVIRASGELERVPFVFDATRLQREIARRYVELGDRAAAVQVLHAACTRLEKLGAAVELAGARAQLRELGVRVRAPRVSRAPSQAERTELTKRMIEVARVVASGKTNKEAARALGISDRTVSTLLSEVYKRLQITSRGQLAEWVRRGSLLGGRGRPSSGRKKAKPALKQPAGSAPGRLKPNGNSGQRTSRGQALR